VTGKRVVVVASGDTERSSVPHLARHLAAEDIVIDEVRQPRSHRALTGPVAADILVASWFELSGRGRAPDKFVVLVDADGKDPRRVLEELERTMRPRIGGRIPVPVLTAFAQWHLEAWFFADQHALRGVLGRDLGAIDASDPDAIRNPKHHLKQLLGKPYTARVAEEIARGLSAGMIAERSASFRGFEAALRNGGERAGSE
jgi:hypothetical protein